MPILIVRINIVRLVSYLLSIILITNSLLLGLAGTAKFDARKLTTGYKIKPAL